MLWCNRCIQNHCIATVYGNIICTRIWMIYTRIFIYIYCTLWTKIISSIQKCFVVGSFLIYFCIFWKHILFKKDFSLIQYEVKNALINGGIVYNLSKHNRSFLGCFNSGRDTCITRELFLVYSLWTWTWNAIYCWWVIRNKTKHMPTRFRNRLHNIFWLIKNVIMPLLMTYKSILRFRLWKGWLSCH